MKKLTAQTNDPEYLEVNVDLNLSVSIRVRKGHKVEDIQAGLRRIMRAAREAVNPEREDNGPIFVYLEDVG